MCKHYITLCLIPIIVSRRSSSSSFPKSSKNIPTAFPHLSSFQPTEQALVHTLGATTETPSSAFQGSPEQTNISSSKRECFAKCQIASAPFRHWVTRLSPVYLTSRQANHSASSAASRHFLSDSSTHSSCTSQTYVTTRSYDGHCYQDCTYIRPEVQAQQVFEDGCTGCSAYGRQYAAGQAKTQILEVTSPKSANWCSAGALLSGQTTMSCVCLFTYQVYFFHALADRYRTKLTDFSIQD